MIDYQVQDQQQDQPISVKQLLQDNRNYDKFLNNIENLSFLGRTYHVSVAQIKVIFGLNIKCFLVVQVNQNGQAEIGYVRHARRNQFPLKSGPPIMQIKTPLKYLQNFQLITKNNQLSVNFYDSIKNKNEACQFKFMDISLFDKWIQLIIDLNSSKKDTKDTKGTKRQEIKKTINELQEQNKQLQERLTQAMIQLSNVNKMLKQEQAKDKERKNKDIEAEKHIVQLKLKISQSNEKHQESQKQFKVKLEQQSQNSNAKDKKIEQLEQQLSQSQKQLKQLKSKLNIAIDVHAHENELSAAKNCQIQNMLTAKQQLITKLKESLVQQKEKQQQTKHNNEKQIQALKTQSLDKSNLIKILQQQFAQLSLFPFFNGDLNSCQQEKIFLKKSIEQLTKKPIQFTEKLFKFDTANKTGFHHYVDNHQNIALIFKTATGTIVAAFSQSPLNERQANGNGAILSLTNQHMFPLLENRRPISYDQYYIIFGSSQVNIRGGQLKVLSNFGCSSRCYDSKGLSSYVLLGSKCQQMQLQWYQIHQIHFTMIP